MGTEIRTFGSLKELSDYLVDQLSQYQALHEDYSQWLGSLLRICEKDYKNEEWYQKSAALQKNLRGTPKKNMENQAGKKNGGGRGNKSEPSCWVQSGEIQLCTNEQGQAEILFESIEDILEKIQNLERIKDSIQQLERIGLGKNVDYITFVKNDVPMKIVIRGKASLQDSERFTFATDLSVRAVFGSETE